MAGLSGRVIVVTGGASGIGRAVAEKCLASGARVVSIDLSPQEAVTSGNLLALTGDVSDEAFVASAMQAAAERFGGLHGLVNVAGVFGNEAIEDVDAASWGRTLDVNVKGMMLTAKHAFAYLKRSGGGSIVNCSSIMAYTSAPRSVAYTVSKSAILGLTRAVAMDGAPHRIRANAVCPGTIDTPIYRDYLAAQPDPEAADRRMAALYPLGRIGQPEDVAAMCAFLLSDETSWVTGAEFVVDGGVMIKGTNE